MSYGPTKIPCHQLLDQMLADLRRHLTRTDAFANPGVAYHAIVYDFRCDLTLHGREVSKDYSLIGSTVPRDEQGRAPSGKGAGSTKSVDVQGQVGKDKQRVAGGSTVIPRGGKSPEELSIEKAHRDAVALRGEGVVAESTVLVPSVVAQD